MSTSVLLFMIALFAALVTASCALVADRAGYPIMAAGMATVAWLFPGMGLACLAMLAVVG